MGKTRDLFKKIRETKGIFHAKMGSIKDRNGKNLRESEDIKKRWQEYTEELYKKGFHDPDNHDGMITHLEPDILECEVKWALGSITTKKASGGVGIPVELFQILKDDAVKVLHSICQQIWKTQQWPQDWKRSVFIPVPKKGNAKECSNYRTIALISSQCSILPTWFLTVVCNLAFSISSLKCRFKILILTHGFFVGCGPFLKSLLNLLQHCFCFMF